ncbi:MAG: hypothetical protein JOZ24_05415 [Candidatus Eremiobacteraeota bacterium]|nr:hypothetical protein [Candidatus Eremiobacteraeota bacterium]
MPRPSGHPRLLRDDLRYAPEFRAGRALAISAIVLVAVCVVALLLLVDR